MILIESLRCLKTPIVVYDSKDYEFLNNLKKNFNLNFEVYFDSFIPFLDDYLTFSLSNKNIDFENSKIYIFDSIESVNKFFDNSISFSYEKINFINSECKNLVFLSSLINEKEVFLDSSKKVFVSLKDDPVIKRFKNRVIIRGITNFEKQNIEKNKIYYHENLDTFNIIFKNLIDVRIFTSINGLKISNIYLNNKYFFVFIKYYEGYSNLKILQILKKKFINITGILILDNDKIIDYFFAYKPLNDKLIEIKNNLYFISFFDIKINKYNLKIRKDKHFF